MNFSFGAPLALAISVVAPAQGRMSPIPSDKLTPEQKKAIELLIASPRGSTGPTGPFIPLLRSPELMNRLQAVGEYLRFQNSVPQKLVENAASR